MTSLTHKINVRYNDKMKKLNVLFILTLFSSTAFAQTVCKNAKDQTQASSKLLASDVGNVLQKYGDNVPLADENFRGSCAAKNFVNHSLEILPPNTQRAEKVFSNTICDSNNYRKVAGCLETCLDGSRADADAQAKNAPVNTFEMMARMSICLGPNIRDLQGKISDSSLKYYQQIAHQMAENAKDYQKGGSKYQALIDKIHQESMNYQKQMLCENGAHSTILFPGFDPEVNTINYGYSVFKSNDYKNALNLDPETIKDETLKYSGKVVEDRMKMLKFCDEPKLQSGVREYSATIYNPREAAIRLDEFKQDNIWTFSGADADSIISRIQNNPMMIENLKCGRIPHFEVYASSNEKANTKEAAEKFGRWGFKKLSEARAQEIKNQILSKIVLKDSTGKIVFNGSDPHDMLNKVTTKLGYKDTGVSGPCPYLSFLDSHGKLKIVPDPAYNSKSPKADPEKIKELEKAKGVRVTLRFEGTGTCNNVTHDQERLAKKEYERIVVPNTCFQVAFKCNPN